MNSDESTPSRDARHARRSIGGRPGVNALVRLDSRISAACTRDQASRISAAAAAAGMTVSAFLLDAALGVRVQAPVVPREWREVWAGLAPLASNFHALVRHLNFMNAAGEIPDAGTYDKLLALVPELAEQLSELRQTLIPTR